MSDLEHLMSVNMMIDVHSVYMAQRDARKSQQVSYIRVCSFARCIEPEPKIGASAMR